MPGLILMAGALILGGVSMFDQDISAFAVVMGLIAASVVIGGYLDKLTKAIKEKK